MNKKLFALLLAAAFVFSGIAFSSCSPQQRRPGPTTPAPGERTTPAPGPTSPAPDNRSGTREQEIADDLADRISRMEGVNRATVILAGDRAWVGLDLEASLRGEVTREIKDKVTQTVKDRDKTIRTVYVTADADTVTRLQGIAEEIARGRPVSGFMDELNEIGRRAMPSVQ
jgi:YhcN/YlaJ family sporulation lipoprotein